MQPWLCTGLRRPQPIVLVLVRRRILRRSGFSTRGTGLRCGRAGPAGFPASAARSLLNDDCYLPCESGGAKGVDTLSLKVAKELGFKTEEYKPEKNELEYYKKRNLQLAEECDELYCFSVSVRKTKCYHHKPLQNHEKTAGCWTSNMAKNMNKPCQLVVID